MERVAVSVKAELRLIVKAKNGRGAAYPGKNKGEINVSGTLLKLLCEIH